ncbi:ribonucleoside-diphosphate reductase subunit beta [Candidatus Mycoplasma haematohominis]|uniref:Ribonucleoside-diphosphate reductase subunit beta n=1 Tax=Candidatus Mycoplasma haematohominis TaxID=1494318 RepID=A0A478FPJ8_9MOLU|nr:ribonucleoside-diphosphate reductase subunit beta [Candidatus Mycoplasma haemohominis]
MIFKSKKPVFTGVNWNKIDDTYSKAFWDQNVRQFWIDEEIPLSGDKIVWNELSEDERDVYKKVLVGLTLLDTHQGTIGMNSIASAIESHHTVAVLQFMAMMEHMHAKSYSSIFSTLCTTEEIDELFAWSEKQVHLQKKLSIVVKYYETIENEETLYMAMVASVFLESFLFYSGFYYILLLSGKGLMVNSGEIINLIIRDEAIHGVYIGLLANEIYKTWNPEKQAMFDKKARELLKELMENEVEYTKEIYTKIGLVDEVKKFLEYNANKALQNLQLKEEYDTTAEDISSIVFNGLKTTTKNHDFFSSKGNGYIKPTKIEEVKDEDFQF